MDTVCCISDKNLAENTQTTENQRFKLLSY